MTCPNTPFGPSSHNSASCGHSSAHIDPIAPSSTTPRGKPRKRLRPSAKAKPSSRAVHCEFDGASQSHLTTQIETRDWSGPRKVDKRLLELHSLARERSLVPVRFHQRKRATTMSLLLRQALISRTMPAWQVIEIARPFVSLARRWVTTDHGPLQIGRIKDVGTFLIAHATIVQLQLPPKLTLTLPPGALGFFTVSLSPLSVCS